MDREVAREIVAVAKDLVALEYALNPLRIAKARKVIKVNWNDTKSIRDAEKQKEKLEDEGFELIKTVGGLTTTELYYEKTASSRTSGKTVNGPDPTGERESVYLYLENLAEEREQNERGRGLSGIIRQMNYVENHVLPAVAEKYPALIKKVLGRMRWQELKEEQDTRMASTRFSGKRDFTSRKEVPPEFIAEIKRLRFREYDGEYSLQNRDVGYGDFEPDCYDDGDGDRYEDCMDRFYERFADKFERWANPIITKVERAARQYRVRIKIDTDTESGVITVSFR